MTVVKMRRPSAFLFTLLLIFSLLLSPAIAIKEETGAGRLRVNFSAAVETSLKKAAASIDSAVVRLCSHLDQSDNIDLKVNCHFYDNAIRRYVISASGKALFTGRLPFRPDKREYFITSNQEISFDISLTDVTPTKEAIAFNFDVTVVFSLDRMAYKMVQTIPHLTASGALGPAFDLLAEFCSKLNIGILSKAISETCRNFSTVAFTKAGTELINQAGKNNNLGKVVRESIGNGSILNYLALTILKTATTTMVSITGATLGSMVGSVIAPGVGTTIGAYFGSQILSLIAKAIVHELTAEIPVKVNIRKMVNNWRILNRHPGDAKATTGYNEARLRIKKRIVSEFGNEKFSLFNTLLEEIDEMFAHDRPATVPLLKDLQEILMFKVTMDGDWYFARQYHQLRLAVEKWGLQKQVVFTTDERLQNSGR